jgi:type I restriction enzyme S subunit
MNRYVKIKDIAVLNRETFKKGSLPNIIKYLDTGSLTKNKIEGFQHLNIKLDKIPSRAQRKVRTNTILYSTVRPNQEHFGIIEREFEDIVASTGFTTIDITDKTVFPKFIFYLITQPNITEYLHTIGMNSVSSYPSISPDDIGNLKFKIPDLPTQKSIAKVLSDLDAKIELNNKINRELEAMAKTLYDYWFVQFDFPDANGKPYKSSGGKMVYNAELKREIPEGWEVKIINKFIEVKDGTHDSPKPKERGFHLITSKNLLESGLDFENANLISEEDYTNINKRSKVETGDILFSMIGSIGVVYKVEENEIKFAVKNVALYKTSQKREYKNYIYQYLKSYDMQRYMGTVISGSIQKFIGLGSLRNMPFLFNKETVEKYIALTNPIYLKLNNIKKQNQQLSELRDWLLPMLMNGQVTVKEAEESLSMAAEPSVEYKKR